MKPGGGEAFAVVCNDTQTGRAAGGKQEEKTQESANQAESKQQNKSGNRMVQQLAAGAEAQGVGR